MDIGGTNIRTAVANIGSSDLINPLKKNHNNIISIDALINDFLRKDSTIKHIVFSVAGPKINQSISMTNAELQIDKKYIPNITFYFKINKKTLIERKKMRGQKNYFDKKYASHFSRIQKNYDEIGKMRVGTRKFITIDASRPKAIIHKEIVENLKKCKLIR